MKTKKTEKTFKKLVKNDILYHWVFERDTYGWQIKKKRAVIIDKIDAVREKYNIWLRIQDTEGSCYRVDKKDMNESFCAWTSINECLCAFSTYNIKGSDVFQKALTIVTTYNKRVEVDYGIQDIESRLDEIDREAADAKLEGYDDSEDLEDISSDEVSGKLIHQLSDSLQCDKQPNSTSLLIKKVKEITSLANLDIPDDCIGGTPDASRNLKKYTEIRIALNDLMEKIDEI